MQGSYMTVDSLDDPEDSDLGGEESPALFSPASSPAPTLAEEPIPQPREPAAISEGSPQETHQPQARRRRRNVRQSSSGQDIREMIDARVTDFFAQRRSDGQEECVLRGLGPLLCRVPMERHNMCVASLVVVIEMYASHYQGDIHLHITELRHKLMRQSYQQPTMYPHPPQPPQVTPFHGQQTCRFPEPNPPLGQQSNQGSYGTWAPHPGQVRPGYAT
ncbi:uncharacterized protein LOC120986912 [Bufo bufo]|uniref:uncharacterized protein LOC120986912 n=1 Tax=Bufo bufo TaxID=8384 RepID=UPI001ABE3121|nr:uncharacterized protein LOC120986912 [Bufo bufo]